LRDEWDVGGVRMLLIIKLKEAGGGMLGKVGGGGV